MGDSKSLEIMDKGIVNPGTGNDLLILEKKVKQPGHWTSGTDVAGALTFSKLQESYKSNEDLRRTKIKSKTGEGYKFRALQKEMKKKGVVGSDERMAYILKKRGYAQEEIEPTNLDFTKEVIPSLEEFPPVRDIDTDDGKKWLGELQTRNKNLAVTDKEAAAKPSKQGRKLVDMGVDQRPAGSNPAEEETPLVSGEPVGTAEGDWPGDEPPPVEERGSGLVDGNGGWRITRTAR